jgi:hypothetical protein
VRREPNQPVCLEFLVSLGWHAARACGRVPQV